MSDALINLDDVRALRREDPIAEYSIDLSLCLARELPPGIDSTERIRAVALRALKVAAGESVWRIPPHNFEVEMALLGAILTNNRAYDQVSGFLLPEHFADANHGVIYQGCADLIGQGKVADPVTLKDYFAAKGELDACGGTQYLARLAAAVVTFINAADYGRTVYDRWLRRRLCHVAIDMIDRAHDFDDFEADGLTQIVRAESDLAELGSDVPYATGPVTMSKAMAATLESAEAAGKGQRLTTGLVDLDKRLVTFRGERLIVLAGRPSMGKTSLATDIAFHVARNHGPVGFFSLEMGAEELCGRILAAETGIDSWKIEQGRLESGQWDALIKARTNLQDAPLFIDDTAALDPQRMLERARKLRKQSGGLALVVVDYLQLVEIPRGRRLDNRVQEISYITRELKRLAKEIGCPVLALSQLSRAVESRTPPRPQLSDLRDSGTIEQDADAVLFVYRPEYYLKRDAVEPTDPSYPDWLTECQKVVGEAHVLIEKQRGGPAPAKVLIHFDAARTRFTNYSDREA